MTQLNANGSDLRCNDRMAKRKVPGDKGIPSNGNGSASRANKTKAIEQERKQVIEYIESLREFANSILRKWN